MDAYQGNGLAALGDPTRRSIFERIAERPRAVGELAGELPVSRPAVSQHLKVLKDAGLVSDRAEGTRRIYAVDMRGVGALRVYLEQFWTRSLADFKAAVERRDEEVSMSTATDTAVTTAVVVDVPQDRAFSVFTDEIGSWWNPEHHLLAEGTTLKEMVFEPRVGGHVYDIASDGSECRWSRVLAYDPPDRVVFSWDINLRWEVETDLDRTSEVEVRFIPEAPGRTRVELEHRHLDRHGDGWEQMRAAVGSEDGWGSGLRGYAAMFAAR